MCAFLVGSIGSGSFSSIQESSAFVIRSCSKDDCQRRRQGWMATSSLLSSSSSSVEIVDRSTFTLLEHVNLNIPSHEYAVPFYLELLGCGLDPRRASSLLPDAASASSSSSAAAAATTTTTSKTIWANCGASQFHLPYGEQAQTLPGHVGLIYESLEGLKERLSSWSTELPIESYEINVDPTTKKEVVKIIDTYGNTFCCREQDTIHEDKRQPLVMNSETDAETWGKDLVSRYGVQPKNNGNDDEQGESDCRGISYVEFPCPKNSADKIALFYDSVFDATTSVIEIGPSQKIAIVAIGNVDSNGRAEQSLLFREPPATTTTTTTSDKPYDGHHIALYVGETVQDFYQAYKNTETAGVVWINPRFRDKVDSLSKASDAKQFRFKDIIDLETGERIMELEHEIRSIQHESWPGRSISAMTTTTTANVTSQD